MKLSEIRIRAVGNFKIRIPLQEPHDGWLIANVPDSHFRTIDELISWVGLANSGVLTPEAPRWFNLPLSYELTRVGYVCSTSKKLVCRITADCIFIYNDTSNYFDKATTPICAVEPLEFISQLGIALGAAASAHSGYEAWELVCTFDNRFHVYKNESTGRNMVYDETTRNAVLALTGPDGNPAFTADLVTGLINTAKPADDITATAVNLLNAALK